MSIHFIGRNYDARPGFLDFVANGWIQIQQEDRILRDPHSCNIGNFYSPLPFFVVEINSIIDQPDIVLARVHFLEIFFPAFSWGTNWPHMDLLGLVIDNELDLAREIQLLDDMFRKTNSLGVSILISRMWIFSI